MRKWETAFITAAAFCVLTASPAFAKPDKGHEQGHGRHDRAAPGPIAGVAAGLPVLVAAGGYLLYRRRRNQGKQDRELPS